MALRPGRRDAGGPNQVRIAGVSPATASPVAPKAIVSRSRGYLPHLDGPSLVQHVVFRLADSLPASVQKDIGRTRPEDRIVAADVALDNGYGRRALENPAIGDLVQSALLAFDGKRYELIAWCVMPNHVHVLLEVRPGHRLDQIVHSWKSFTAKKANGLLRRSGPFWAREYFDRLMRDEGQLARTAAYIEANPVAVRLCANIGDWRFSSACSRRDAGGPHQAGTADALPATTGAAASSRRRQDAGAPDRRR